METSRENRPPLVLTRAAVRQCDKVAIERYGIVGVVLMENAGGSAARVLIQRLADNGGRRVCVLAGPGNNGGDGFVVARHLANAGYEATVLLAAPRDKYTGDAAANLAVIEKMRLPIEHLAEREVAEAVAALRAAAGRADWLVDALLGTGAAGAPREPIRSIIQAVNELGRPVLALDIPSGLDCDTGAAADVAVRATATVTFAALKQGFKNPAAAAYTGPITTAGIGIDTRLLVEG